MSAKTIESRAPYQRLAMLILLASFAANVANAQSIGQNVRSGFENNACKKISLPVSVHQGVAVVNVSINQKPYAFIVDSAGTTIINSERVSLPIVGQIRTGPVTIYKSEALDNWDLVHVDSFRLGHTDLGGSEALSRDLRFIENHMGIEIGGILGNDTLMFWDSVSINYKLEVLQLERKSCPGPKSDPSLDLQLHALGITR